MRYKLLGNSGLRVSEVCLGCMTFGQEWGSGADRQQSQRIFETFAAAGGNFLDTADLYTDGTSERWLGEMVARDRERFVLASKYTLSTRKDDPNAAGMHRKNLVQSLEASLTRLGTPYLDVLYVHAWDGLTDPVQLMRALDDQVRLGKVLHVAISDAPAWQIARACTLAAERGWTPFCAAQMKYSLLERTPERDLIPMAGELGLAVTTWGSLGGGQLTGKYLGAGAGDRRKADEVDTRRTGIDGQVDDRSERITRELLAVAEEIGCTPGQAALAWVAGQPQATVIPIVGARTADQLADNLQCVEVTLTPGQRSRLDAASATDLGFPHEFLRKDHVRGLVHGDLADRIDGA
jgi:aryl-alcohol dehydrogenase-like predicted oxidoreductase